MVPFLADPDVTLYVGDALETLRGMPDGVVHCAATSPPFYGLRDYGTGSWEGGNEGCDHRKRPAEGFALDTYKDVCGKCGARRVDQQIGLEPTPDLWVSRLVEVFREVRRVLRPDGTLWVECGDSYSAYSGSGNRDEAREDGMHGSFKVTGSSLRAKAASATYKRPAYKPKDLLGQPWLLAFALRQDGWYLRQAIIWAKPNAMPESARDRCTTAHSYVFLFSKRPRYFFDAEAIAEPAEWARWGDQTVPKYEGTDTASGWMKPKSKSELVARGGRTTNGQRKRDSLMRGFDNRLERADGRKNARSVWQIPTKGYPGAHFATWPETLVERIIKAGTSERGVCPECGAPWVRVVDRVPEPRPWVTKSIPERKDNGNPASVCVNTTTTSWIPSCDHAHQPTGATVLDPFMGSGTTALVARRLGRQAIGVELNPEYAAMCSERLQQLSLLA